RSYGGSALSFAEIPVESTRSQNITVTCRRSPVASGIDVPEASTVGASGRPSAVQPMPRADLADAAGAPFVGAPGNQVGYMETARLKGSGEPIVFIQTDGRRFHCTARDCAGGCAGLCRWIWIIPGGGTEEMFCLRSRSTDCSVATSWAISSCLVAS